MGSFAPIHSFFIPVRVSADIAYSTFVIYTACIHRRLEEGRSPVPGDTIVYPSLLLLLLLFLRRRRRSGLHVNNDPSSSSHLPLVHSTPNPRRPILSPASPLPDPHIATWEIKGEEEKEDRRKKKEQHEKEPLFLLLRFHKEGKVSSITTSILWLSAGLLLSSAPCRALLGRTGRVSSCCTVQYCTWQATIPEYKSNPRYVQLYVRTACGGHVARRRRRRRWRRWCFSFGEGGGGGGGTEPKLVLGTGRSLSLSL